MGHSSVELLELRGSLSWVAGPELPVSLARACAVTSGDGASIILVGGHGNDTTQSLDTALQYQGSGGGWTQLPSESHTINSHNWDL